MNRMVVFTFLMSVLLVGIAGYLYLVQPEPLTLGLNISVSSPVVKPGKPLKFVVNAQASRKTAAEFNYTIVSRAGRLVVSDRMMWELDGLLRRTVTVSLPESTGPGPHWITARLSSEGSTTTAVSSFVLTPPKVLPRNVTRKPVSVAPVSQVEPESQAQPSEEAAPGPLNRSQTRMPQEVPPVTPPSVSEPNPLPRSVDEIRTGILEKAQKDPQGAANDCATKLASQQDACYADVALAGKAPLICQRIPDVSSKDACLANIALNGDYSVCESIANADIRESCIALRGTP